MREPFGEVIMVTLLLVGTASVLVPVVGWVWARLSGDYDPKWYLRTEGRL